MDTKRDILQCATIVLLTQHFSLLMSFIGTSQNVLSTATTHQALTMGSDKVLACQPLPSCNDQRNYLTQKWEIQKSFNRLRAIVPQRQGEREWMSVCACVFGLGEWIPDASKPIQILSLRIQITEEDTMKVFRLKHVALGKQWQSHSAVEGRRKPVWSDTGRLSRYSEASQEVRQKVLEVNCQLSSSPTASFIDVS